MSGTLKGYGMVTTLPVAQALSHLKTEGESTGDSVYRASHSRGRKGRLLEILEKERLVRRRGVDTYLITAEGRRVLKEYTERIDILDLRNDVEASLC